MKIRRKWNFATNLCISSNVVRSGDIEMHFANIADVTQPIRSYT